MRRKAHPLVSIDAFSLRDEFVDLPGNEPRNELRVPRRPVKNGVDEVVYLVVSADNRPVLPLPRYLPCPTRAASRLVADVAQRDARVSARLARAADLAAASLRRMAHAGRCPGALELWT